MIKRSTGRFGKNKSGWVFRPSLDASASDSVSRISRDREFKPRSFSSKDSRKLLRVWVFTFHVILPMLVGGVIYISCRTESLRMFSWLESAGLQGMVFTLREAFEGKPALPNWFVFSLPDALWVYSFSMYMGLLWVKIDSNFAATLMMIGPAFGIGGEIGQFVDVVPGTFDLVDLGLCLLAMVMALKMVNFRKGSSHEALHFS